MQGSIFVSYARADAEFAHKLANDLRRANVPVWMDQVDIAPGQPWDRSVEQALHSCAGILLVLSPQSVASRSVMDEVSYALDENKMVLPVIYQECEIPFRLRRLQRTDLRRDYAAGVAAIVEALASTEGITSTATTSGRSGSIAMIGPERQQTRMRAAFITAAIGAVFSVFALFLIYANDVRIGTSAAHGHSLLWSITVPAIPAIFGWGIAGALAPEGPRRIAFITSGAGLVVAVWIAIFGTYADVMMAAVVVGAPLGSIVGAVASRWVR